MEAELTGYESSLVISVENMRGYSEALEIAKKLDLNLQTCRLLGDWEKDTGEYITFNKKNYEVVKQENKKYLKVHIKRENPQEEDEIVNVQGGKIELTLY